MAEFVRLFFDFIYGNKRSIILITEKMSFNFNVTSLRILENLAMAVDAYDFSAVYLDRSNGNPLSEEISPPTRDELSYPLVNNSSEIRLTTPQGDNFQIFGGTEGMVTVGEFIQGVFSYYQNDRSLGDHRYFERVEVIGQNHLQLCNFGS